MQKTDWLPRFNIYIWLMAICCLVETLCFTYLQTYQGFGAINAVLYFISGLGICILAMLASTGAFKAKPAGIPVATNLTLTIKILLSAGFLLFMGVLLFQYGANTFEQKPINYHTADMLPLLKTACERWIHGEHVYSPVKEVWGGEDIPYLPAMWMPFAPALWLHTDIRWVCILLTAVSIALVLVMLVRMRIKGFTFLTPVFFLCIFMVVKFYTWEERSLFELTEEAIPAFYYLLLMVALMLSNDWLIAITLALCTLSRFSLLPFIPFFFIWLVLNRQFKRFFKIGLAYTALVFALFVIPFFIEQPGFFLDIPHKYMRDPEGYWRAYNYTLLSSHNLGLAYIFGYNGRELLSILSAVFIIAAPLLWLVAYWVLKKRHVINKPVWAMAGLKLSLLVFYNFIGQPYLYIFLVPTLISYPLFLAVVKEADI